MASASVLVGDYNTAGYEAGSSLLLPIPKVGAPDPLAALGRKAFKSVTIALLELRCEVDVNAPLTLLVKLGDNKLQSKSLKASLSSVCNINMVFSFPYNQEDTIDLGLFRTDTAESIASVSVDIRDAGYDKSILSAEVPLHEPVAGEIVARVFSRIEFGLEGVRLGRKIITGPVDPLLAGAASHRLSASPTNKVLDYRQVYSEFGLSPTGGEAWTLDLDPSPVSRAMMFNRDTRIDLDLGFRGVVFDLVFGARFQGPETLEFQVLAGSNSLTSTPVRPDTSGDFRVDQLFSLPFNNQRKFFILAYKNGETRPYAVSGFDVLHMANNGIVSCRQQITFIDDKSEPVGFMEIRTEFTREYKEHVTRQRMGGLSEDISSAKLSPAAIETLAEVSPMIDERVPLDTDFKTLSFAILNGIDMCEEMREWRVGVSIGGFAATMPTYVRASSYGRVNFNFLISLPYNNQPTARLALQGYTNGGSAVFGVQVLDLQKALTSRKMRKKVPVVNSQGERLGCICILAQASRRALYYVKSAHIHSQNLQLLSSIPIDILVNFSEDTVATSPSRYKRPIFSPRGLWRGRGEAATTAACGVFSGMRLCSFEPSKRLSTTKHMTTAALSRLSHTSYEGAPLRKQTPLYCACNSVPTDTNEYGKITTSEEIAYLWSRCPALIETRYDLSSTLTVAEMERLQEQTVAGAIEVKLCGFRDLPDVLECGRLRLQLVVRYGKHVLVSSRLKPSTMDANCDIAISIPFSGNRYVFLELLEATCIERCIHLGSVCLDLKKTDFSARRFILEISGPKGQSSGFLFVEAQFDGPSFYLSSAPVGRITIIEDVKMNSTVASLMLETPSEYSTCAAALLGGGAEPLVTIPIQNHKGEKEMDGTVKLYIGQFVGLPEPFPFKKFDVYVSVSTAETHVETPIVQMCGPDALCNFLVEIPVGPTKRIEVKAFGLHVFGSETLLAEGTLDASGKLGNDSERQRLELRTEFPDYSPVLFCSTRVDPVVKSFAVVRKLNDIVRRPGSGFWI